MIHAANFITIGLATTELIGVWVKISAVLGGLILGVTIKIFSYFSF